MTAPVFEKVFSTDRIELTPYDPGPTREIVRGLVAASAILTFLVVVGFYLYQSSVSNEPAWKQVKDAMQAVLPAVTSILGTVLGFYFGSKKR